jgi:DNA invertase Pin-like site-specific DNA recombinase
VVNELQKRDTLVACKLDRIGRSTLDLLKILDRISAAGAGFKSLGDLWADTTARTVA